MWRCVALFTIAAAAITGLPTVAVPTAGAGEVAPIAEERIDWQAQPVRLLMVTRTGCIYCAAWDREIAPGYAKTDEGRAAPLLRVDIDGPWPDGIALARRPTITPTFVVLREGAELTRLEGYPGDEFFYPVLDGILNDADIAPGGKESE